MTGQSIQIMCGIKLVLQSWKCILDLFSLSFLSPLPMLCFVVSQALKAPEFMYDHAEYSLPLFSSQAGRKCFLLEVFLITLDVLDSDWRNVSLERFFVIWRMVFRKKARLEKQKSL